MMQDRVNILMVDDQPGKLLSYEAILSELGENLIKASSGREALEYLLKTDVAVVLMDVSMPEIDGFQLADMIRQHPRFQKTAIIFISAVHLTDLDRLKGYERGAVDYISVPVIPDLLRAKVSIFSELHRKRRQLEQLNRKLEQRVEERTRELQESESQFRTLANSIPQLAWMANPDGSVFWYNQRWYDYTGQTPEEAEGWGWTAVHHEDHRDRVLQGVQRCWQTSATYEDTYPLRRKDGQYRWFLSRAVPIRDSRGETVRWFGTSTDISEQIAAASWGWYRAGSQLRRHHSKCSTRGYAWNENRPEHLEESRKWGSAWLRHIQGRRTHFAGTVANAARSGHRKTDQWG
jgi:PAS domain S-box-containing protein